MTQYRRRNRIIAIGASLVIPGGGHFYAGLTKHALAVVACYVLSTVIAIAGAAAESPVAVAGAMMLLTTLGFDVVGAQRAITRSTSR